MREVKAPPTIHPSWPSILQPERDLAAAKLSECGIESAADSIGERSHGHGSEVERLVSPRGPRVSGGRKVGRVRRYDGKNEAYGAWEDVRVSNAGPDDGSVRIGKREKNAARLRPPFDFTDSPLIFRVSPSQHPASQISTAEERSASSLECCRGRNENLSPRRWADASCTGSTRGAKYSTNPGSTSSSRRELTRTPATCTTE